MQYELVCKAFTITGPSITAVVEEWGKRKHGQPDYAAITIERLGPVSTTPEPRPPQPTRAELQVALKQCLHVIEKGIETRMGEQWSVLRHILPDAVEQARRVLGVPPRKSGEFEAMDRMYGTGDPAACFHEWQGFECTKCGMTRREYDANRRPPQ